MTKPQYLTHISLAGVDNDTKLEDLEHLTYTMPKDFVEWSLLYMPTKQGQPRNPDEAWRTAFFDAAIPTRNSVHLCGTQAFTELLNGTLPADIYRAQRWQINANARGPEYVAGDLMAIYKAALASGKEIILQVHEYSKNVVRFFHDALTTAELQRVTILMDDSRGFGTPKMVHEWMATQREAHSTFGSLAHGYAGGIQLQTIDSIIETLSLADTFFYLDLESGSRVDNKFDRELALAILAKALPYRHAMPR